MVTILSMGAGVNTSALLFKYWERYVDGAVIFADTGDELPETYAYIDMYLKPFCKDHGITWHTVVQERYPDKTLLDHFERKRYIADMGSRWCTRYFKIEPIHNLLKKMGASEANPFDEDIGFTAEEEWRANKSKWEVPFVKKHFPLLEDGITRKGCEQIIRDAGYPLPRRSGCFYCPLKPWSEFKQTAYEHPNLMARAARVERNLKGYEKDGYTFKEGHKITTLVENAGSMDGHLPGYKATREALVITAQDRQRGHECDSGYCTG